MAYKTIYLLTKLKVKILLDLGPSYRIVMYGVAFIFKFITRFICVETLLTVMPRKHLEGQKAHYKKSRKVD